MVLPAQPGFSESYLQAVVAEVRPFVTLNLAVMPSFSCNLITARAGMHHCLPQRHKKIHSKGLKITKAKPFVIVLMTLVLLLGTGS